MIRILIAEDSQVVALLLKALFELEPDMQVVGHARNGREAVQMTHELKPDLVTMDIRMPVMDGFEATRQIMASDPTPIVVVSASVDNEELSITFKAIEEGALSVIEKPRGISHPDFDTIRRELIETVRAMAEVKVIRRRFFARPADVDIGAPIVPPLQSGARSYELLAIGCSTGGPQVLHRIFSSLAAGFPVPIVVTQHISKGFIGGLIDWLSVSTPLKVKVAQAGEKLQPGTIYFAPDDRHLKVLRSGPELVVSLGIEPEVNGFRPSACPMFKSVASACGKQAVGVLLTGMGVDGAEGLLAMRKAGGHTLVQDEESSVVYGMPGAALALDAADQVVEIDRMSSYLTNIV